MPLDDLVNWNNIYDWARQVWTHDGKTWALPEEAYTDELYHNKDLLAKLGTQLPANAQFDQSQFLDLVKKARDADNTPIAKASATDLIRAPTFLPKLSCASSAPTITATCCTGSYRSRIRASSLYSSG